MNILQAQNLNETMSSSSKPNINKKSFHWRNDSGELDVFEAARYFNDRLPPYMNLVRAREQQQQQQEQDRKYQGTRRSLDVPIMRSSNPIPPPDSYHHQININHHHIIIDHQKQQQQQLKDDENKKLKQQPRSPGGRLASFLNSLFNQTSLKKKKKEREESPSGRRKRRSSISHFRLITKTTAAAPSADKGSGFRTPPPYAITPTKSYKQLARFAEHAAAASACRKSLRDEICGERNATHKLIRAAASAEAEAERININGGKIIRKLINDDDESDSSSDLFDLPIINHDLDLFGSSLPVYATTHMEKRITINSY